MILEYLIIVVFLAWKYPFVGFVVARRPHGLNEGSRKVTTVDWLVRFPMFRKKVIESVLLSRNFVS